MRQQLKEIRKKLYLHRDGASSSSMRDKGVSYKINFGVPIITLRKIAQDYSPNPDLANELWGNDNRELKILATLIHNPDLFSDAGLWIKGINNVELAEQSVMNLFGKLTDAIDLSQRWVKSEEIYTQLCGWLLYTRLFIQKKKFTKQEENFYFNDVFTAIESKSILIKNAALNSLKQLGDNYKDKSQLILKKIEEHSFFNPEIKKDLYEELSFEF